VLGSISLLYRQTNSKVYLPQQLENTLFGKMMKYSADLYYQHWHQFDLYSGS